MGTAAQADYSSLLVLLKTQPSAAAAQLRQYAVNGDPFAQLLLGKLLVNGVGLHRDPVEALSWFRSAAGAKNPMAMNMVGRCYEYGLGTPVSYELRSGTTALPSGIATGRYTTTCISSRAAVECRRIATRRLSGSNLQHPAGTREP